MIVSIIGGGLAGCEAAWQLTKSDLINKIIIYEMRPEKMPPANVSGNLAELVCSNSLHSELLSTGAGLLKREMSLFDSLIVSAGYKTRVPAGHALSVDRKAFSEYIEKNILSNPKIQIIRKEINNLSEIKYPAILATGPLFSGKLCDEIHEKTGKDTINFFDAVSPMISGESIDYNKVFFGNRYEDDGDDYLNIPLTRAQYEKFYNELINAKRYPLKDFENVSYFDGCLPVEVIASRGIETLRFGPLRPVGLTNDRNIVGVVQLRKEDSTNSAFNIVGFQTNLLYGEQKRVFSLLPGLENAEFLRYGKMHRNSYFNSPVILNKNLEFKNIANLFLAGQLTGVEGYCESAVMGILSAYFLIDKIQNKEPKAPPKTTMMGALLNHILTPSKNFMPMNSNFGIIPPLENPPRGKKERKLEYSKRAIEDMTNFLKER
jgi:methylenetetrahydrofolate--tRNA-(uracil-5-)-methyltransferase